MPFITKTITTVNRLSQLHKDIMQLTLTANFEGVTNTSTSDDYELEFDITPTVGDIATIDAFVLSYSPVTVVANGDVGEHGSQYFYSKSNTINKWLSYSSASNISSDRIPLIMLNSGSFCAMTFTNLKNNIDCDIEIYKNGSLFFSWEVRNKRYQFDTDLSSQLDFVSGDLISVFCRRANYKRPAWVTITLDYKYVSTTATTGGASSI